MPLEPQLPITVCFVSSHLARVARVESSRLVQHLSNIIPRVNRSISLQSILGMTFAIDTITMFSFPLHSGGRTPAILTIVGSDSGGSAGIQIYLKFGPPCGSLSADPSWYMVLQADVETFTVLGCYGASVIIALTAQNTKGIQAVHIIPPSFVEEQVSFCHCASPCYQGVLPSV